MGRAEAFKAKGGGPPKRPNNVANRVAHAQALLNALDALPKLQSANLSGLYLDIEGRPNEVMVTSGLNASDLKLLRFEAGELNQPSHATVYASAKGLEKLRTKIQNFEREPDANQDGTPGRPKNADLAQSISAIVEAGLRALWRSPPQRFPAGDGIVPWEVWLDRESADQFINNATARGIVFSPDRLDFPEDVVVIASASAADLATAVRHSSAVRALAAPSTTAEFYDNLPPEEQAKWVDSLRERTTYPANVDPNYITLLDRGVSLAHPLLAPALAPADRHAAGRPFAVIKDGKLVIALAHQA